MITKLGVIAEDDSDVAVIRHLVIKITGHNTPSIKRFVGRGCGPIRAKCNQWARHLGRQGCNMLLLVHDLDQNDYQVLLSDITNALKPSPIRNHVVCIPVREIESWLLCDVDAVRSVFGLKSDVGEFRNPELIEDPKKALEELVFRKSGKTKRYLNAAHNPRIAEFLAVEKLRRCQSFLPLERFLLAHYSKPSSS